MRAVIAVLPGDGVGPEVTAEAVGTLRTVGRRFGHVFDFREGLIGGRAIAATGSALPDETLALCRSADATLLGAVGGPQWNDPDARVRPEQGLLALRQALGLFANLRPVRAFPALAYASPLRRDRTVGVDLLFVRELLGGAYFGEKGRERAADGAERAFDACVYTSEEIARVVRVAAALAAARRGKLTSVDKANVLETSRLWRSITARVVQEEFPGVSVEHLLVDAFAMHLLQRPADFDVIVTDNLFGDILTDEAAVIAGSIGLLPSAALAAVNGGRARGLYEPIHGSAPEIAGRGIANPIGAILSAALLLRYSLGLEREALAVERAVQAVLDQRITTPDIAARGARAYSCGEVGEAIADAIAAPDRARPAEPAGARHAELI